MWYNISMRTVSIETSVISYLTGRPSHDLLIAACQQSTRDWWEGCRSRFHLHTSELVIAEARRGDVEIAGKRLDCLRGIPELHVTAESRDLAKALVERGALPQKAQTDALHIAVAAVHHMDLLLTWNCRHIDNPVTKPTVRSVCAVIGYPCPEVCTPIQLLEAIVDEKE
jgi:predicted nucleic acid-binding protein